MLFVPFIVLFTESVAWAQAKPARNTDENWRAQVIGTILGPTRFTDEEELNANSVNAPTVHELALLMEKEGSNKFDFPVGADLQDVKFQLVQCWKDPERNYPLIGSAKLEHRLYLCTVLYRSKDADQIRKFVIEQTCFVVNREQKLLNRNARGEDLLLKAYPKLRSYDDLEFDPVDHTQEWPGFLQGGSMLNIDWQIGPDAVRRKLSNQTNYVIFVNGRHLYLYHSQANYIAVYELFACEETPNGEGRQVCLTRSNGEKQLVEISEHEFVFLSHGDYPMTGFSMSKLDSNYAEDTFQGIVRRNAFLLNAKTIRFCGEDIKELPNPLSYLEDRGEVQRLHLQLDNPEINKVVWFHGSASQEARLRHALFEPDNTTNTK